MRKHRGQGAQRRSKGAEGGDALSVEGRRLCRPQPEAKRVVCRPPLCPFSLPPCFVRNERERQRKLPYLSAIAAAYSCCKQPFRRRVVLQQLQHCCKDTSPAGVAHATLATKTSLGDTHYTKLRRPESLCRFATNVAPRAGSETRKSTNLDATLVVSQALRRLFQL